MTTYTIKTGKKNFRPYESPLPIFKPKGFRVSGHILPGGWASKEEWQGDRDRDDWQKLKGITHFFSLNDHRSCMIAFNYGDEYETYNLTAYTNDKSYPKGWFASGQIIVESKEHFEFENLFGENCMHYSGSSESGLVLDEIHQINTFRLGREVGTSPGGKNNSPGPYGGRAFKDMSMVLDFKILH